MKLPKPSKWNKSDDTGKNYDYIISYLNQLVSALEKNVGTQSKQITCVKDISVRDSHIIVTYTDGSTGQFHI